MKLSSLPLDFAPAYGESSFCFEELSADQPTEVAFWLGGEESQLLGIKRYVGAETIAASPANLLRRAFNPQPLMVNGCAFVYPEERNKQLVVKWGDNFEHSSTPITYVASKYHLAPETLAHTGSLERVIANNEYDEVAFVAPAQTQMSMKLSFSVGSTLSLNLNSGSKAGLWVLCLNFGWIFGRLPDHNKLETMTLEIKLAGECIGVVNYRVAQKNNGALRLAWLTPYGTINYHTFPVVMERRTAAEREAIDFQVQPRLVGVNGAQEIRLRSGTLPAQQMQQLAELVSSPAVWIVDDSRGCEQVEVVSAEMVEAGPGASDLTMVVRPLATKIVW